MKVVEGGGGGAILIACGGSISVDGTISANGGWGGGRDSAGGSGGTVRLVADTLRGSGVLYAYGGQTSDQISRFGGQGRIRLERVSYSGDLEVLPGPSVVDLTSGASPLIWLPDNGPQVRILSIGGTPPPADPRAEFGAAGPDVSLPQVSQTEVVVETTNVEQISTVRIRVAPRAKGDYSERSAAVSQVVSTDPLVLRWIAQVPVTPGYSALQVHVIRP